MEEESLFGSDLYLEWWFRPWWNLDTPQCDHWQTFPHISFHFWKQIFPIQWKKKEDIILCDSTCICPCDFIGNMYLILVEYFQLFHLLHFISNFNEVYIKTSNWGGGAFLYMYYLPMLHVIFPASFVFSSISIVKSTESMPQAIHEIPVVHITQWVLRSRYSS